MRGTIVQVNTSRGGLPKTAVLAGQVTAAGVAGDAVAHPAIHGGPRKAVLLIASEVVDQLKQAGWPVYYGALGENLTTAGIDAGRFRPGQRYRAGEAVLELTEPRVPCSQLHIYGRGIQGQIWDQAVRAGDVRSRLWGKSGFYARVVREGLICPGDAIELE